MRLNKFISFAKRPLGASILAVVVLVGGIIIYRSTRTPKYEAVKVSRGHIVQEVTVTGRVESAADLSLSFEKSGKVIRVNKNVGDRVSAGETIAQLDASDLLAQLASAKASVQAAQAKLDELNKGTRAEELAIKQTALDQKQLALSNLYNSVGTTLENAYINADDAVRKQTDAFFTNDEQLNPTLSFHSDLQMEINAQNSRAAVTRELNNWQSELNPISAASSPDILDSEISKSQNHLLVVQNFLKDVADALVSQIGLNSTSVTAYQTSLTTARTETATSLSSVISAKQNIASAKLDVSQAQNDLNLAKAGSTPEAIAGQEAQVKSAEADADQISANLAKTSLRAPISGIITKQDAKVGQIVGANVELAGMIGDANFQIQTNIPETDIANISLGQTVNITLDAFPNEQFEGRVASIDPAETIVDGAVNFKVKVVFTKADPRIKSGLTANLGIETSSKDNVLILPQYAILQNDDGTFVDKLENGKTVRLQVKTGIQSKDGEVEIISGVGEGEEVLNIGIKTP